MMNAGKRETLTGLGVAAVALAVYVNALGNDFALDDWNIIVNNPVLRESALSLFSRIDVVGSNDLNPYYRPLTLLSFLMETRLLGPEPFPMHLVNVILHSANAFLVYRLARHTIDDTRAALLAGLFFAVHPVNTEAVDLITARNTLMSTFFALLAFLLHRGSVMGRKTSLAYAGALTLLAGLLSKETALMLLPFVLALEADSFMGKQVGDRRGAVLRLLPYAVVTLAYLVMRWMVLSKPGIQTHLIPGLGTPGLENRFKIPGVGERLLDNLYIIPRYLLTLVRPTALTPTYQVPEDFGALALPLAVAWAGIIAAGGWLLTRGRSRATVFGLAWMGVFWFPVSGVFFFPSLPMADRYLYTPAIGLWIVVADQALKLQRRGGVPGRFMWAAMIVVLVLLSVLTVRRNIDWRSDLALFLRAVEQYPENPANHAGLGHEYVYLARKDPAYLDLAERECMQAVTLNPMDLDAHTNMGYIRLARGDSEGAVKFYTTALAIFPLSKEARINRAIALENLGREKEALDDFRQFLATPGYEYEDARPYAEARVRALTR